jgi:hypothetical protein
MPDGFLKRLKIPLNNWLKLPINLTDREKKARFVHCKEAI